MPLLRVQLLAPLALVTLLLFTASLYGLAALGHFPRATRQDALLRGAGPIVLWCSMAVAAISVAVAFVATWWLIPWHAAIIAGGIAILVAPLVLQYFSDDFVDGRSALLSFSGASATLAAVIVFYMQPS